MYKQITIFLLSIFFTVFGLAQSNLTVNQNNECAFEASLKYQELSSPQEKQMRIELDKKAKDHQSSYRDNVIDIPIKAYILNLDDGTGGISECDLKEAMDIANAQFAPAMYNLVICELEHINSFEYYYINTFAEGDALYYSNNNPNALNIYFAQSAAGYCGWANFPASSKRYIMMANSCAMNTSTLAHEIGHYFGLYHTHQGGNELVDGSNCVTAGDLICDTDADPTLSYSKVDQTCQYIGTEVDANGDLYTPDPLNLMSYSRKECRDIFSIGQEERMDFFYTSVRAAQLTCSGSVNLCGGSTTVEGCGITLSLSGLTVTYESTTNIGPHIIKIRTSDWSDVYSLCNDYTSSPCNSGTSVTVSEPGDYVVDIQGAVTCTFTITLTEGGVIDSDGDGIPDDEDCAPFDPNLPVTQDTPCDDGDSNTYDDKIRAGECDCYGTPSSSCEISVPASCTPEIVCASLTGDILTVDLNGNTFNVITIHDVADYSVVETLCDFWTGGAPACNGILTSSPLPDGSYLLKVPDVNAPNGTCWIPFSVQGNDLLAENISRPNDVVISPNPNNGLLIVHLPKMESGQLLITDIQGRVILKQSINNEDLKSIDMTMSPAGVYFIRVYSDDNTYVKKMVKN